VQDIAGDVVEDEVRLRAAQLHGHESLAVVDELYLVGRGLELARPCLGPAAARHELNRAAFRFSLSSVQFRTHIHSSDQSSVAVAHTPVSAADVLQAVVVAVHVHVDPARLLVVRVALLPMRGRINGRYIVKLIESVSKYISILFIYIFLQLAS
jgi:hypothetical protein